MDRPTTDGLEGEKMGSIDAARMSPDAYGLRGDSIGSFACEGVGWEKRRDPPSNEIYM
jgi:hypothetical protein